MLYRPYGETAVAGDDTFRSKFNTHESDRTALMYFNARYYDAEIGRFVSADSDVPNPKKSQAFNRYMFVCGNPVKFVDTDGHSFISDGFDKMVESVVTRTIYIQAESAQRFTMATASAVMGAVFSPISGAIAGATAGAYMAYAGAGGGGWGILAGIGGAILGAAIGGALGSVLAPMTGMACGVNGYMAATYDIYSGDSTGVGAYFNDSTIGSINTLAGMGMMAYGAARGGHISGKYSKGHNAFVMTDFEHPAGSGYGGIAVGNFVGIKESKSDLDNDPSKSNVAWDHLRHELIHTQQYRGTGSGNLARIFLAEQLMYGKRAYDQDGFLENYARSHQEETDRRPGELGGDCYDDLGYQR